MSEQWGIENDTGAELTVRAPNGFAVELDANSADPRERFAYFAIRQQARDLDQLRADLAAAVGRSSSLERTIATLQMRLRRAGQLLIEEIGADGPEAADDTAERAAAVIRNQADAIAALSSQLGNLLAVIHRDGGHYESEHGTERACADAETAVHVMRGCVDGFISSANEWRQRAEQAEARLAAIESAPTVAWQWMDTGHFRKNKPDGALVFDWRPLIARPAKD